MISPPALTSKKTLTVTFNNLSIHSITPHWKLLALKIPILDIIKKQALWITTYLDTELRINHRPPITNPSPLPLANLATLCYAHAALRWFVFLQKLSILNKEKTLPQKTVLEKTLIIGATGGVGQLTVAKLLQKRKPLRILTRSQQKAQKMFEHPIEIAIGDIRHPQTLLPALQDITQIIACTGTTAFPSARWDFDLPAGLNQWQRLTEWFKIYTNSGYRQLKAKNTPEKVDAQGIQTLVNIAPKNLKRLVFVSSCGIERKDKFPYRLLNSFGVLDAKQQGEQAIINSGLPYTIIRPARLIDGPYTSYDLNTLLQAKTEGNKGIVIAQGDHLSGETSRIDVANACVECLDYPVTSGKIFEIINQGTRPPTLNWGELFASLV